MNTVLGFDKELLSARLQRAHVIMKDRLVRFLAVSLALHLLLLVLMNVKNTLFAEKKHSEIQVDFVKIDKEQIDRIRNQVAETALIEKTKTAVDNAYLGKQTQTVREQTKAQTTAAFRTGTPAKGGAKVEAPKNNVALNNLGVKMNFKPLGSVGPGESAATSDFLKDVKNGAETMLNTKEFAFFSFYQRVRQQLEQYWEPNLRTKLRKMFDRGRKLAGDQQLTTKIVITLNSEGTITKLQVESTSGYMDLDDAAVEAFNKAGPFPNPPHGMIETDGKVHIDWFLVLQT